MPQLTIEDALNEWAMNYQPSAARFGKQSTAKEMGNALRAIRDKKLYRENFSDFYVYCARKWGMKPETADWYIAVAEGIQSQEPVVAGVNDDESLGRYVYFIEGAGMIKIGVANNVSSRFNSIRTMSPVPLKLIGFITGDIKLEAQLHSRFHQHRRHGEWFVDCQEIRNYLAEVLP